MNTLNIYQGEKIVFVSGNAKFFWNFGMYISSHLFIGPWVHCEGPQWRARPVCRQDSASHPTPLFLHDFTLWKPHKNQYHRNHGDWRRNNASLQ